MEDPVVKQNCERSELGTEDQIEVIANMCILSTESSYVGYGNNCCFFSPMRPPSPGSIHSWWSYSNPPGPTISLHPLAIRLNKLLYHRRVVGILKRQGSHPLSPQKLDVFIPYLQFNEILTSTKIAILEQIDLTSQFELGAEAIFDANLLQVLVSLLAQSPDPRILRLACSILFHVSCHEELKGHVIDAHVFQPLVSLLQYANFIFLVLQSSTSAPIRDPDTVVRIAAARALEEMASISDFTTHEPQVVDAASLLFLGDLLHSTDHTIRLVACKILSTITASGHKIHTRLIVDMSSNIPFLSLIRYTEAITYRDSVLTSRRNPDPPLRSSAVHLLSRISPCITTGHRAKVFDVAMLDALLDSLKSADSEIGLPVWTCRILEDISSDQSIVQAIIDIGLLTELVSMLRHSNRTIHFAVLSSLYQMGSQVKSDLVARNIVGAGALPLLVDLLRSECGEIIKMACGILGHIATHPILVEVMVSKNATTALASLLRMSGNPTHRAAASTLRQISCRSETGAAAVAEALVGLLHCTDIPGMIAACEVLATIAGEAGVIEADINPCLHIVALVGHPDLMVRDAALAVLHKISRVSDDGACTVSDAIISNANTALPKITLFLRSIDVNTLLRTCDIVASIACGDHARKFIVPSDMCAAILSLSQLVHLLPLASPEILNDLRHPVIAVNHAALSALLSISARSEKQAKAVASRSSLRQLVDLLASHDANVLELTCQILANIACHDTLLAAVIETELCPPVAALLRHSMVAVSVAAMSALCWISRQLAGACALVNAKVLPEVGELLQSTNTEILTTALRLLHPLASEKTLSHNLVDLCPALVALLKHGDMKVLSAATEVLGHLSRSDVGAESLVHSLALPLLNNLLESSSKVVVHQSCCILGNISQQETLTQAVIDSNACCAIVAILRQENLGRVHEIRWRGRVGWTPRTVVNVPWDKEFHIRAQHAVKLSAAFALFQIYRSSEAGARAVLHSGGWSTQMGHSEFALLLSELLSMPPQQIRLKFTLSSISCSSQAYYEAHTFVARLLNTSS